MNSARFALLPALFFFYVPPDWLQPAITPTYPLLSVECDGAKRIHDSCRDVIPLFYFFEFVILTKNSHPYQRLSGSATVVGFNPTLLSRPICNWHKISDGAKQIRDRRRDEIPLFYFLNMEFTFEGP